ncbi:MAG: CapA family protein [Gemmatimonadales bacterium]
MAPKKASTAHRLVTDSLRRGTAADVLALGIAVALTLPCGAADARAQGVPRSDVRVCAGGDVSLGTNLDTAWVRNKFDRGRPVRPLPNPRVLLAPVSPLVTPAAIVLLNIEGAIGEGPAPRKCARHATLCYALRQPPASAPALRHVNDSAAVVGNIANNHAHDAGDAGVAVTRRLLAKAGVLVTGADTLATPVPAGNGDTVAVLGFSSWSAAQVDDTAAVHRLVAAAAARYGRVIVMMHAGAEGDTARHTPDSTEFFAGESRGNSVAFAHAAVAGGASLVIGSGPHVLRALEWDGPALIAYSLGNLVTYGPFNHTRYTDDGAVLCATLAGDGSLRDAVLRSTRQRAPGYVRADSTGRGARDIAELTAGDFPLTGAEVTAAGEITRRP